MAAVAVDNDAAAAAAAAAADSAFSSAAADATAVSNKYVGCLWWPHRGSLRGANAGDVTLDLLQHKA